MGENPVCIRQATSLEEAEVIAAWLEEQGVAAHIVDPGNHAMPGITDVKGVGVFVEGAVSADKAKGLLADHDRQRDTRPSGGPASSPTHVICEECGAVNEFPADTAASVQKCDKCRAYLDTSPPEGGKPAEP